ncbi:myo-inositol-1(or 4)-monophosphatase [Sulfobacillus acidophilus TPY]|uniref:Inositol-1-monophosphatase n=1 Tax=Sulfobacillus acidophilus (strain ATCC 700253 / DSM 10332 / NAL) TaxID=679936 RepID=G8TV09_SULAD|nr:myo-inositol-1(or 4)-monophosphatase [Sulfobacillus acidophilus TPY]AEW03590.1 inositol monophosphatase [Sulfobacillus acidophilus DSM 10332]
MNEDHLRVMIAREIKSLGQKWRKRWHKNHGFSVDEKAPNDYVTSWDYVIQKELISVITEALPNSGVLSEELNDTSALPNYEVSWILDPIDGTANLMHHHPHFAISLALAVYEEIRIGWVYDFLRDELFTATRGCGAWLNNRRIHVSTTKELRHALVAIGTKVIKSDADVLSRWNPIFQKTQALRLAGSAALDLAWIACGRLDGYVEEQVFPWDWAAGHLIVLESTGLVTTWNMAEPSLRMHEQTLVAGNTWIHNELKPLIPALKNDIPSV